VNVNVTAAATIYFLKRRLLTFFQCHVLEHSAPGRRPEIKFWKTLRTAPVLCKIFALEILFGSNGNSFIISTQSDNYTYSLQYSEEVRTK